MRITICGLNLAMKRYPLLNEKFEIKLKMPHGQANLTHFQIRFSYDKISFFSHLKSGSLVCIPMW